MSEPETDRRALALEGIDLCRRGRWNEGLHRLGKVAATEGSTSELPSQYYAYLGYGLARFQRRIREGLQLCEHAVKQEFFQVDNYSLLARTAMLAKNRRRAIQAIEQGLAIDHQDQGLLKLQRELGVRRQPVLRFLSRDNTFNRILGRLRHAILH